MLFFLKIVRHLFSESLNFRRKRKVVSNSKKNVESIEKLCERITEHSKELLTIHHHTIEDLHETLVYLKECRSASEYAIYEIEKFLRDYKKRRDNETSKYIPLPFGWRITLSR